MDFDWKQQLARMGCAVDDRLDALSRRLRDRAGGNPRLQILPYRGFGNGERISLNGRVLLHEDRALTGDSSLQKILASYRRFHSREVPGKSVTVRLNGAIVETVSDHEGFFDVLLPNPTGDTNEAWHEVECATPEGVTAVGEVLIPPKTARFGVISDIDDTIIISHATNFPRMLHTLLLKNARGRVAFPGVAAFYRALQSGMGGEFNPIFYVSSGPWNLYDLLVDFMELNQLPRGPLFLQDYGFERDRFICASHHTHKLRQIERIMACYPHLPFILIGDSGQHDPEVYAKVLEEMPNRIPAVYIRDVSGDDRDEQVRALGRNAKLRGTDLLLVRDSLEAARHAATRGFISANKIEEIAGDQDEDRIADRNDR
jgi:phosphatidate phosphatase APP1